MRVSRRKLCVSCGVALSSGLAGCSGIFDQGPDLGSDESQDESTNTDQETTDSDRDTDPEEEAETGEDDSEQVQTDEIVLSRSNLADVYETKGSLDLTRKEASGEDADRFEERELRSVSERTFTLSDSDTNAPEIVFSSAIQYQSETAAENDLNRIISEFEASGEEVSEQSVTSSTTARVVQFQNDQGYQNIAFYGWANSVVFYVVTSDNNQTFPDRTEELFKQMLVNASDN